MGGGASQADYDKYVEEKGYIKPEDCECDCSQSTQVISSVQDASSSQQVASTQEVSNAQQVANTQEVSNAQQADQKATFIANGNVKNESICFLVSIILFIIVMFSCTYYVYRNCFKCIERINGARCPLSDF